MGAFFRGLAVVLGCLLIPVVFLLCFVIVDLLMTQQQVCPGIALLFVNALLGWTAFRLIAWGRSPSRSPRNRVQPSRAERRPAADDADSEDGYIDTDDECGGFKTKLVGVSYNQALVRKLKSGQTLQLVREPDNPGDPNAVSVRTEDGVHVGYLSRFRARMITESMFRYRSRYTVRVLEVTGWREQTRGVNVHVSLADDAR